MAETFLCCALVGCAFGVIMALAGLHLWQAAIRTKAGGL